MLASFPINLHPMVTGFNCSEIPTLTDEAILSSAGFSARIFTVVWIFTAIWITGGSIQYGAFFSPMLPLATTEFVCRAHHYVKYWKPQEPFTPKHELPLYQKISEIFAMLTKARIFFHSLFTNKIFIAVNIHIRLHYIWTHLDSTCRTIGHHCFRCLHLSYL